MPKRPADVIDSTAKERKITINIIEVLPEDVFMIILPFCSLATQFSFARVSKDANRLSKDFNVLSTSIKTMVETVSRHRYVRQQRSFALWIKNILVSGFAIAHLNYLNSIWAGYPTLAAKFKMYPQIDDNNIIVIRNNSVRIYFLWDYNGLRFNFNRHQYKDVKIFKLIDDHSKYNTDNHGKYSKTLMGNVLHTLELSPSLWLDLFECLLNLLSDGRFRKLPIEFRTKYAGDWSVKYKWTGMLKVPLNTHDWIQKNHEGESFDELFVENPVVENNTAFDCDDE